MKQLTISKRIVKLHYVNVKEIIKRTIRNMDLKKNSNK